MDFGPNTWLALAGYTCVLVAIWAHSRGRIGAAVLTLAICATLLRLSASLDPTLHEWDERYHALVAKNMLEEPFTPRLYPDAHTPHTEGSWAKGHIWLNKPPLTLWSIAASLKCFGYATWAVRVPSILLSIAALLLLYGLGRSLFSERVAFWAALLFAVNGHLIELASGRTSNDHPDTFLMCLVLASLFAAERMVRRGSIRWAALAGTCLGLAFLSKSWPAAIVLPVTLVWQWSRPEMDRKVATRLFVTLIGTAVLVALPWDLYSRVAFPEVAQIASASHWQHFTHALEDHGRPWTYYWSQLPMLHGELAPLALLLFLLGPFRSTPAKYTAVVVWWLLPYLIFSLAVTKMPAYVVLAAPALCLILAVMIEQWQGIEGGTLRKRFAQVGVALLVLLPLRFSLDRVAPWRQAEPRYTIAEEWHKAAPNTVVTNCPWPIELMFHTPVVAAYADSLSSEQRAQLIADGYVLRSFRD